MLANNQGQIVDGAASTESFAEAPNADGTSWGGIQLSAQCWAIGWAVNKHDAPPKALDVPLQRAHRIKPSMRFLRLEQHL